MPRARPIAMVKSVTPKYSARQKNGFFIGRNFSQTLFKSSFKIGVWIAYSQNEKAERYFAALKSFSLLTITNENFKISTQVTKVRQEDRKVISIKLQTMKRSTNKNMLSIHFILSTFSKNLYHKIQDTILKYNKIMHPEDGH